MSQRSYVSAERFRQLLGKQAKGRSRSVAVDAGGMNRTESAYAEFLAWRKRAGEISEFWFEQFKVRLANGCWWTPDFLVQLSDGSLQFHEVKAAVPGGENGRGAARPRVEDDALVKVKVSAELFSIFPHYLVFRSETGEWVLRQVGY